LSSDEVSSSTRPTGASLVSAVCRLNAGSSMISASRTSRLRSMLISPSGACSAQPTNSASQPHWLPVAAMGSPSSGMVPPMQ
jgi:hypothetical protein